MARIEGIDLPRSKRVEIGLTYIMGIGLKTSHDTSTQNYTEQKEVPPPAR